MNKILKSIICTLGLSLSLSAHADVAGSCKFLLEKTLDATSVATLVGSGTLDLDKYSVFEVSQGKNVVYRYSPPKEGKPTIVLMNGLIYSLDNWDEYFEGLAELGYGVALVAFSTQPESIASLNGETPYFGSITKNYAFPALTGFNLKLDRVETQDYVDEVTALLDHLEIDKFILSPLSYSSTTAVEIAVQLKDRIDHFVLQAPAVRPSNRYNPIGETKHQYYELLRVNPFVDANYPADMELWFTLLSGLPQQYVKMPNPLVNFDLFLNGVYQMVRSVKWFDLKDYARASLPKTHLFLASGEESNLLADQLSFWELMNENEAQGARVYFDGFAHALPASATAEAIEMMVKIIEGEFEDGAQIVVESKE